MKILFYILISAVLLGSCNETSLAPYERSKSGLMTAMVNGKPWSSLIVHADFSENSAHPLMSEIMGVRNISQYSQFILSINKPIDSTGTYKLGEFNPTEPGVSYARYETQNLDDLEAGSENFATTQDVDGALTITRWDTEVIEGTFHFLAIDERRNDTVRIEDGNFKILLNR